MPGFNTSTKKEDLSIKLRTQNLKNARDQTKRLEEESKKMEERLKELKMAMQREKETREKWGVGYWSKGQSATGSLNKYAQEVLQNQGITLPADGKLKKVKVLREVPQEEKVKPVGPPGTLKYIAQRKLPTGAAPRDKQKGSKCGQCEDRAATLSCVQCSEIYCPGCFTAFHLKGALTQHRSVPLSASGPRVCMSPSAPVDVPPHRGGPASGDVAVHTPMTNNGSEAAGPPHEHTQPPSAPQLLEGEYDESRSAASFQAALMAWRQQDQFSAELSGAHCLGKPAHSVVDESTGTSEEALIPDIKFRSTLTYAEKLMVKEHLRMKQANISLEEDVFLQAQDRSSSSCVSTCKSQDLPQRPMSQSHSSGLFSNETDCTEENNDRRNSSIDEEDHVDFESLFEAVTQSPPNVNPVKSDISITELFSTESPVHEGSHLPASYTVKEVSPLESWKTQHIMMSDKVGSVASSNRNQVRDVRLDNARKVQSRQKDSTGNTAYLPNEGSNITRSRVPQTLDSSSPEFVCSESPQNSNYPVICDVTEDGQKQNLKYQSSESSFQSTISDLGCNEGKLNQIPASPPVNIKLPRPNSRLKLSKTDAKRAKISKSSQPSSKTRNEGYLTKAPSEELKIVSQLRKPSEHMSSYTPSLGQFLLAGVDETEQPLHAANRVLTPTKERNRTPRCGSRQEDTKNIKLDQEPARISNRLYQMAPKSWCPHNSIISSVAATDSSPDPGVTVSYCYSKHKTGEDIEWSPSSSLYRNIDSGSDQSNIQTTLCKHVDTSMPAADVASVSVRPGQISSPCNSISPRTCPSSDATTGHRVKNTHSSSSELLASLSKIPAPPDSKQGLRSSFRTNSIVSRLKQDRFNGRVLNTAAVKSSGLVNERSSTGGPTEHFRQMNTADKQYKPSETLLNKQYKPSETLLNKSAPILKPRLDHFKGNLNGLHKDIKLNSLPGKTQTSCDSTREKSALRLRRNFQKVMSQSVSAKRPSSSTHIPLEDSQPKQTRPKSSTDGGDTARTQLLHTSSTIDTIVADTMASRVQSDGWVGDDTDFSNDYDDGDHLFSLHLKLGHKTDIPELNNKNSNSFGTEVQPFLSASKHSQQEDARGSKLASEMSLKKISAQVKTKTISSSRPTSVLSQKSGRISRTIVMDGDDLSLYDSSGAPEDLDMEDKQALDQLEWELASSTGRITADGKISRLSIANSESSNLPIRDSINSSIEKDYDILARLVEEERRADKKAETCEQKRKTGSNEIEEVRALR